jgi:hypothetical protein
MGAHQIAHAAQANIREPTGGFADAVGRARSAVESVDAGPADPVDRPADAAWEHLSQTAAGQKLRTRAGRARKDENGEGQCRNPSGWLHSGRSFAFFSCLGD